MLDGELSQMLDLGSNVSIQQDRAGQEQWSERTGDSDATERAKAVGKIGSSEVKKRHQSNKKGE